MLLEQKLLAVQLELAVLLFIINFNTNKKNIAVNLKKVIQQKNIIHARKESTFINEDANF